MPWFRSSPWLLSRLLGISTTLWLCRKVGCWAKSLSRLGALVLRFVRRGRVLRRIPDYGHLLLVALYPGNPPGEEAAKHARYLADEAGVQEDPAQALGLLGEAVLLSPPDAKVYLAKAQAYHRWQRHVEALDDAELCVSIDGTCVEGWLAKGRAEHALGRSADAAISFQAGLELQPGHEDLQSQLASVRAEPQPNLVRQFKDLIFAARLGLDNLFRTLEDPEKTTDAFVESNRELLDAQVGLLAQTLHVNTVVLFESPRLCDAYEQIVHACSQLVMGAPAAFSKVLKNARSVVEGLSLAMRLGWHVHHSIPKLAANALIILANCPNADDQLRRLAVRQLLSGFLRWLLDARPESDRDAEEICGCSCSVPWKAAACFLERLFEPGRPQPWIREECEAWPDSVQLCQWLTLSVRDYHATPLGLVGLLQMPGVALAAMRSQATVDFFIAPPPFVDEDHDLEEAEEEELTEDEVEEDSSQQGVDVSDAETWDAARASGLPWWRAAQLSRQPLRMQWRQARVLAAVAAAAVEAEGSSLGNYTEGGSTSSSAGPPTDMARFAASLVARLAAESGMAASAFPPHLPRPDLPPSVRWIPDPSPPPAQRLGEWLMASLGYLFLFIEGDALFTVCACRALQTLVLSDPAGDGRTRLLRGMWLGVPLLSKLSLMACNHTAALDLLHCLCMAECPVARAGIRAAVRSLAHALTGDSSTAEAAHISSVPRLEEDALSAQSEQQQQLPPTSAARPEKDIEQQHQQVLAEQPPEAASGSFATLLPPPDEDMVPSWAEFHHELLQELAYAPPRDAQGATRKPELVTLFNFESKAALLAEHAVVRTLPAASASWSSSSSSSSSLEEDDAGSNSCLLSAPANSNIGSCECFAVPAAWNRGAVGPLGGSGAADSSLDGSSSTGSEGAAAAAAAAVASSQVEASQQAESSSSWQAISSSRLRLFHEPEATSSSVGSAAYIADPRKQQKAVLMSRRSIRLSPQVHNWAQAVAAAEKAGASAVIVYNDLDGMEPFRMGLFGEKPPSIPAFMVSGKDGAILSRSAVQGCHAMIVRSVPTSSSPRAAAQPAPWPLSGGRLPADVAQAWSLLEALSANGEPGAEEELGRLLQRMSVPEKRVWLTRRLVRHHRAQQAASSPEGELADPPLAFVEGDRWLSPAGQLTALRKQLCEGTGLGSEDICGEFEVRFREEQGVGSAVVREWMDMVAREAFLNPRSRLLRSFDRRQTFWPDAAATFCNPRWQMDYEVMGRLVGLALWQSCTLDMPLHPHVCALLFGFDRAQVSTSLGEVDEDLERNKVRWLLAHPVLDLGIELPFSDPLCSEEQLQKESAAAPEPASAAAPQAQAAATAKEQEVGPPLPALVRPGRDQLEGTERSWEERPLMTVGSAEVALGEDYIVTDDNKAAFVEALTEWKLFGGMSLQVEAMARGLGKVVPEDLRREMRSLLSPLEIAQLLSGLGGAVSVEDWERHTSYTHGLTSESPVVLWFWKTVHAWADSPEESRLLPQLLQFVTGSARVPVGGFNELVGFNGAKHAFTLASGSHLPPEALPMAHACICTLDLPPYKDFETCRAKMTQMLLMGRAHFDEAAGRADGGGD
eukprot:TRINITY_DN6028_c0_g1_i1.p1 TRINITY_DN6028_c0_g1~~TRINITY_DN6028_c0_g1_i1.p1  ORF type:complete len:1592 (+),score=369.97 TRINITY_DN6028_c0_g1_i1:22-4797(+)